jgi:hypothetical protein
VFSLLFDFLAKSFASTGAFLRQAIAFFAVIASASEAIQRKKE